VICTSRHPDVVLGRIPKITEAVRNLDANISAAVVVLTGDTSFAGTEEQFLVALDSLHYLRESLAAELNGRPPVHLVIIPGNHDCDFSTKLSARDQLVETIYKAKNPLIDDSIITVCTEVQSVFFDFRDMVCDSLKINGDRLFSQSVLNDGASTVVFRCLNTA
jgi:hypothetical protein